MDAKLFALTLDLQAKARVMTQADSFPMRFAALDMLDYLGAKIDEGKAPQASPAQIGDE